MNYAQCGLTCVMWFEMQNIWLPCKGIQVVDLVVFILVTVSQIHNIVSSSRGGIGFCWTLCMKKAQVWWKGSFSPVQKQKLFLVSVPSQAAADLQSIVVG